MDIVPYYIIIFLVCSPEVIATFLSPIIIFLVCSPEVIATFLSPILTLICLCCPVIP